MLGKELPRVPSNGKEDSSFFEDNAETSAEIHRRCHNNSRIPHRQQQPPITCRLSSATVAKKHARCRKLRWPLKSLFLTVLFVLLSLQVVTCQRTRGPTQRPGHRRNQRPSLRPSQRPGLGPSQRPGQRPSQRPGQRPSQRPTQRINPTRTSEHLFPSIAPKRILNPKELELTHTGIVAALRLYQQVCHHAPLNGDDPESLDCLLELLKQARDMFYPEKKSKKSRRAPSMYLRLFRRNKGKYDDLFRLLDPESIPRKIWKRAKMPEESKAKNPMIKKRQAGNYIELHHIKSSFDPDSLINNKYFNIKRKLRGLPHPNKYCELFFFYAYHIYNANFIIYYLKIGLEKK